MSRKLQDVFFKQAKREDYLARSAYKLLEMQKKYRVISKGGDILDLGASPGAWLQVAAKYTSGRLVGVDLKEIGRIPGVDSHRLTLLTADALDMQPAHLLNFRKEGFHTVLSDLCHATSGNSAADAILSLNLGKAAANLALGNLFSEDGEVGEKASRGGVLVRGGNMVVKLLEGHGMQEYVKQLRPAFAKVHFARPTATRSESREVYLVALGRRTRPDLQVNKALSSDKEALALGIPLELSESGARD